MPLKGQFKGQQMRCECGKKTLPPFAVRLLNQQTCGERGGVQTNALGLKIFSKFIWKIYFFLFLPTITIHI